MKCLIVLALCIYSANAAIKCVQGKDGAAAATDCTNTELKECSQPLFVEFSGMSADVEYACGKCAGETKDKTCSECTGTAEDGCNKPKEAGADFMCFGYTYDATAKTWTAAKEATACKRLKDTAIACNSPKATADDKTWTSNGCGPCAKDDANCAQCDKDSCKSSAIRAAVFFAPLLAVFFNLL